MVWRTDPRDAICHFTITAVGDDNSKPLSTVLKGEKLEDWLTLVSPATVLTLWFMQAQSQWRCKCRCNAIFFWHKSILLCLCLLGAFWGNLDVLRYTSWAEQLGMFIQIRWCSVMLVPFWHETHHVSTCSVEWRHTFLIFQTLKPSQLYVTYWLMPIYPLHKWVILTRNVVYNYL